MDYLSNDFVYKSQPEIIIDNILYDDNGSQESRFLTDKQIEDLLEPYENNSKNKNKLFLFLIFFFIFFFIFYFRIF